MNAVADMKSQIGNLSGQSFLWLIKREFWEHRGRLLFTPLVVAGVLLAAMLISLLRFGPSLEFAQIQFDKVDEAMRSGARFALFIGVAGVFTIVNFFVIGYYILDTLYAERRDRSVLFWKSLPLSDVETVLSKLGVASLAAPLFATLVSIVTSLVVMLLMSIVLSMNGRPFAFVWNTIPVFQSIMLVLYALVVAALWYLPIVAWGLLASAWARRAPFLWAVVPIGAAALFEYIAFRTNYIARLVDYRLGDGLQLAFLGAPQAQTADSAFDILSPAVYFSSPSLWLGLLVAAGLVAATVWVRRYREGT